MKGRIYLLADSGEKLAYGRHKRERRRGEASAVAAILHGYTLKPYQIPPSPTGLYEVTFRYKYNYKGRFTTRGSRYSVAMSLSLVASLTTLDGRPVCNCSKVILSVGYGKKSKEFLKRHGKDLATVVEVILRAVMGYGTVGVTDVISALKALWEVIKALSTKRPRFSGSDVVELSMRCKLSRSKGYRVFTILGGVVNAYASVTAVPNRGYSKLEAVGELLEINLKPVKAPVSKVKVGVKPVKIRLLDHTMCKDIRAYRPVMRTYTFKVSDAKAVSWIKWGDVSEGHNVTWVWFTPKGEEYFKYTYLIPPPRTRGLKYYREYVTWCYILIRGYLPSQIPGRWTVKIYLDGSFIFMETFEITA